MVNGITKRWLFKYVAVTAVIILVYIVGLSVAVRSYYYDGIKDVLTDAGYQAIETLSDIDISDNANAEAHIRSYVENFGDKEKMELSVLDLSGNVQYSSTGLPAEDTQWENDAAQAMASANGMYVSTGLLASGEKIMTCTVVINDKNGETYSILKFAVSLTEADSRILYAIVIIVAAAVLLLSSVVIPGLMFIRTIVKPVRELCATARRIAQGDFETKPAKLYDDEIGELSDSINYMSDEIKASDSMKNDFISSVSHELRTPLTAIKGWAETMSIGEPDPVTMGKGLSIIINETERLSGMVEELLDFSRLQNGRMVLVMDKMDLLAELDEAVYMLKERAVSENKRFVYEPPEGVTAVLGDKNRLRQVFINIIDNAIKYTPEGGVIGIRVAEADDMVHVIISDTGCGIAAEDLPKIKDKFYKANQTVRGSGIGLAVADEIMKLHKGRLDIASEENAGTTVTISIPLLDSDDEEILRS